MKLRSSWILAAMLVTSNGWWMFKVLDLSVTRDHQSSELERRSRQVDLLSKLATIVPRAGTPAEVAASLHLGFPNAVLKVSQDTVEIADVRLSIHEGHLVRVTAF